MRLGVHVGKLAGVAGCCKEVSQAGNARIETGQSGKMSWGDYLGDRHLQVGWPGRVP